MPPTRNKTEPSDPPQATSFKYIVPPGLFSRFHNFLNHCKVAQKEPIMIVGDTGVGKSMFLRVAEKLFEQEYGRNNKKHPVRWENCAHFDKNLARSELFGHVKGAYTDAIKDAEGCVKLADNGLLILEEIGELPEEVQAMLLTFIETGKYKKLGSPEECRANVRIVGATNREDALRNDFRYRFLPFYVPSIHSRREDVLYYLYFKFPDLVSTLTMREVLALLAYNWPGNIREINRVGYLMRIFKLDTANVNVPVIPADDFKRILQSFRLSSMSEGHTLLDANHFTDIFYKIQDSGCNIEILERLLNNNHVSFSDRNGEPTFKKISSIEYRFIDDILGDKINSDKKVAIVPAVKQFDEAFEGYKAFCALFGQDPIKNKNIITDLKNVDKINFSSFIPYHSSKFKGKKTDLKKLQKAIMRWLIGVSEEKSSYPDDPYEYWKALEEQKRRLDEKETGNKHKDISDIWSLTESDLRKTYYEGLLERARGNVRKASKMAGLKETTFRARMDSLAIRYKKDHKNSE